MIYYGVCVGTGLMFFCFLTLAFNPPTPLRLIVFGSLAIGVALLGAGVADKVRDV
jgi:hypothetical protein